MFCSCYAPRPPAGGPAGTVTAAGSTLQEANPNGAARTTIPATDVATSPQQANGSSDTTPLEAVPAAASSSSKEQAKKHVTIADCHGEADDGKSTIGGGLPVKAKNGSSDVLVPSRALLAKAVSAPTISQQSYNSADEQDHTTACAEDDAQEPVPSSQARDEALELRKLISMNVVDLADEAVDAPSDASGHAKEFRLTKARKAFAEADPLEVIRANLPPDPLVRTPFGERRVTYADYTASGRSLRFIEEYISRVVAPMFANTHTEASATGLQTSHFREEARAIIMQSLHADVKECELIFTGTGSTGAIFKLISILGLNVPKQMRAYMRDIPLEERPLVLISHQEHHSNELMWRESIADVLVVPFHPKTGGTDLDALDHMLQKARMEEKRKLIIGSFSAGSNVTGILNDVRGIARTCHQHGAYACFDYAAAAPYVCMDMGLSTDPALEYLDAMFISPHKFVGGPGSPGLLCVRKSFANVTHAQDYPPSIPGGGTVTMVWPGQDSKGGEVVHALYEKDLKHREEAGTPGIIESIRCGLAFHARNLVNPEHIEKLEGAMAKRAVDRWLAHGNIWVLGQEFTESIQSEHRLSITSFNIQCVVDSHVGPLKKPSTGEPLWLHPHYVSALLNDLYGIQSRSGCSCAAPLGFKLFNVNPQQSEQIAKLAENDGIHSTKPGWCRINFNYFIAESEFDFLCSAVEQIATHGWRLLPLYALCLRTGMSWFNGVLEDGSVFNRKAGVRSLKELELHSDGTVSWKELPKSTSDPAKYLEEALKVYEDAPKLIRRALYRFRDLRRKDQPYPAHLEPLRRFVLGSEILPHLGITAEEVKAAKASVEASNPDLNPQIVEVSLMTNRPRG